jgi:hypothetical protein
MIKMTCCFCEEEMKIENGAGHSCETTYYQPVKTLTDEEIEEVMYKCDWAYDPVAFARAILRKAQEK